MWNEPQGILDKKQHLPFRYSYLLLKAEFHSVLIFVLTSGYFLVCMSWPLTSHQSAEFCPQVQCRYGTLLKAMQFNLDCRRNHNNKGKARNKSETK
jgi:hypothetical protein